MRYDDISDLLRDKGGEPPAPRPKRVYQPSEWDLVQEQICCLLETALIGGIKPGQRQRIKALVAKRDSLPRH
jgi:hypothetical protein